jgi:hypothetical protein
MTRKRWIYKADGRVIDVSDDAPTPTGGVHLWTDAQFDGLKATDGTDISSRTKYNAYMKATGVTRIEDFTGDWERARKARDEYFTTGKGGAVTREDVGRAIHELEQRG